MEQIRSFIAVELPGEVKQALAGLQAKLKGNGRQVKWVEPENLHLTLQFLGNIDAGTVKDITAAITQGAIGTHPFTLEVGGLGMFPGAERVQTIWVGLSGEMEKLIGLQRAIGANLQKLGFEPEKRPFTPHLTLGRVKDFVQNQERALLGQLVTRTPWNGKYRVSVTAVNLMKSQLTREGPIYSKLATVPLK